MVYCWASIAGRRRRLGQIIFAVSGFIDCSIVNEMQKPSVIALAGVLLALAGFALVLYGVSLPPTGLLPVEIDYANSGLIYQGGVYYDSITVHNYGFQQVSVIVSIKTGLDYEPRSSTPVKVCSGCSVNVLIEELQPPPSQTPQQQAQMLNSMTHPESLNVNYASPQAGETKLPSIVVGILTIFASSPICLLPENNEFDRSPHIHGTYQGRLLN